MTCFLRWIQWFFISIKWVNRYFLISKSEFLPTGASEDRHSRSSEEKPQLRQRTVGSCHKENGQHSHRQLDSRQQTYLFCSEELLPPQSEGIVLCGESSSSLTRPAYCDHEHFCCHVLFKDSAKCYVYQTTEIQLHRPFGIAHTIEWS